MSSRTPIDPLHEPDEIIQKSPLLEGSDRHHHRHHKHKTSQKSKKRRASTDDTPAASGRFSTEFTENRFSKDDHRISLDRISLDAPGRPEPDTLRLSSSLDGGFSSGSKCGRILGRLRGLPIGLLLGMIIFIIFSLIPLDPSRADGGRGQSITLGLLLVMCLWWFTETLPVGITGLLPIVVMPIFGVVKIDIITSEYANDVIFLFVGSFTIAVAMERWNLHKRIAYLVLLKLGADIRKSLAGFIALGAFMSMFLSNSTSAMILTPIVTAVSGHLERMGEDGMRVEQGLLLAVAFAVGIGGCATPIGSPTNLVFLKVYKQLFPLGPDVTFLTWVAYGLPLAIICCAALYALIWFFFLRGFKDAASEDEQASIHRNKLDELGPMGFAEKIVLADLAILMLLWIFRGDFNVSGGKCVHWNGCMPGWSNIFPQPSFIGDGGISVLAAVPLFLIPSRSNDPERPTVVDWKICVKHLPWDVLWLMGGGFALARSLEESGLSKRLGLALQGLSHMPPELILAISVFFGMLITQFASNTGTAALLTPILAAVGAGIQVNPVYLMVPLVIGCSFAFLLPVSTPPDAIVYATNKVPLRAMAKTGGIMLIICFGLLLTTWFAFGRFVFGADPKNFPDWADLYGLKNSTAAS